MDCDMDLVCAAGKLSHATSSPRSDYRIHAYVNSDSNTHPAHTDCFTNPNANFYTYPFAHRYADNRIAGLPEAA